VVAKLTDKPLYFAAIFVHFTSFIFSQNVENFNRCTPKWCVVVLFNFVSLHARSSTYFSSFCFNGVTCEKIVNLQINLFWL